MTKRAPLTVVFENAAFVVVDKPAGWLSVPSREGAADERPCVGIELQEQIDLRLWPVHRLDLEVSGLLCFAKSAEAHRAASVWFEGRTVTKSYAAWVAESELLSPGAIPDTSLQRWESRLLRGKKRAYEHEVGKIAITEARCLGGHPAAAAGALGVPCTAVQRWELHPLTGRAHQLRYEMSRRIGPILGDALYGSKLSFERGGIALRAVELDFTAIAPATRHGLPERISLKGF